MELDNLYRTWTFTPVDVSGHEHGSPCLIEDVSCPGRGRGKGYKTAWYRQRADE